MNKNLWEWALIYDKLPWLFLCIWNWRTTYLGLWDVGFEGLAFLLTIGKRLSTSPCQMTFPNMIVCFFKTGKWKSLLARCLLNSSVILSCAHNHVHPITFAVSSLLETSHRFHLHSSGGHCIRVWHEKAGHIGATLDSVPHRLWEEWGDGEFTFPCVTFKVLVSRGGFVTYLKFHSQILYLNGPL